MPFLDLVCIGCRLGAAREGIEDGIEIRKETYSKGLVAMDGGIGWGWEGLAGVEGEGNGAESSCRGAD